MMHHNTQQNHIYHDRIWKTTRLVVYSHFQTIRRELKFNLFWTHSEACSQFQVIVWFRIRSLTNGKLVTWFLVFYSVPRVGQKGGFSAIGAHVREGLGATRIVVEHLHHMWLRRWPFSWVWPKNQPIIIQLMQRGCCYLRSAIQIVLYMNLLHVLVGPSITSLLFGFQLIFHRP